MNTRAEASCTETDLKILHDELKSQYRAYIIGAVFILIVAFVMPWLGSSKTHGKAMINYMPYWEAVISIIVVMGLVITAAWLLTIPKIKKDLKDRIKISYRTPVKKKDTFKYKSAKGWFIIPAEIPFSSAKKIYVTKNEFDDLNERDEIEISFFPNSKKIIKVTRM